MQKYWQERHCQALEEQWSMPKYLAVLCEEEVAQRENRQFERYLKENLLLFGPSGSGKTYLTSAIDMDKFHEGSECYSK